MKKQKKSEAVGVAARCIREEGVINGKLFPLILQVVRALATVEEENASEEPSVASKPPHSRCIWFVVVAGLTVSHSETEAAALQQAEKQQRSGGGGGKISRLCPLAWLAENTERSKNN